MTRSTSLFALGVMVIASGLVIQEPGMPPVSAAPAPSGNACFEPLCRMSRSDGPGSDLTETLKVLTDEARRQIVLPSGSTVRSKRLSDQRLATLISTCAPASPPALIRSIIFNESGAEAFKLATNGSVRKVYTSWDLDSAKATLAALIGRGANVDIGLMQLNSVTLSHMHVSPGEALDPCRNLAIGAAIFEHAYVTAFARRTPTSPLWSASSIYNTGDPIRGLRNGYAARIQAQLRSSKTTVG